MELDKQKLIQEIKQSLSKNGNYNNLQNSKKADDIIKNLDANTAQKVQNILNDPQKLNKILKSEQVKKFLEDINGK